MTERKIQAGQELLALETQVTRSMVVRHIGAFMDLSEIHLPDRHAHAIGLLRVLAHGMWTMDTGLGLITRQIGDPARIGRYCMRFTRLMVVPDTDEGTLVRFTGTIAAVADGVATANLTATCGGDAVLGVAKVEVCIN